MAAGLAAALARARMGRGGERTARIIADATRFEPVVLQGGGIDPQSVGGPVATTNPPAATDRAVGGRDLAARRDLLGLMAIMRARQNPQAVGAATRARLRHIGIISSADPGVYAGLDPQAIDRLRSGAAGLRQRVTGPGAGRYQMPF